MNKFLLFAVIGVLTTVAVYALPGGKVKAMVDKSKSTLSYTMKHPMHTWDGVSKDVNGAMIYNLDTKRIEGVAIVCKVASFDSQNANRDSHALEVLEGIKFPTVTFSGQDIQEKPDGTLTVTGMLTFHGITRPVSVKATRKNLTNLMQIEGSFPVSLTDYKVEKPSLMMVPVEDIMTISFKLVFSVPEGL